MSEFWLVAAGELVCTDHGVPEIACSESEALARADEIAFGRPGDEVLILKPIWAVESKLEPSPPAYRKLGGNG